MPVRPFPLDRRGVALPTALFALVVVGALVGGVFFTSRLELRGGESAMAAARATEAAQAGLNIWAPSVLTLASKLDDGETAAGTRTLLGGSSYYTVDVTRLNRFLFIIRSTGEFDAGTGAVVTSRTMAQLVKRYMPELEVNSGAIVAGSATIQGSSTILGNDAVPAGWDCPTPGPDQPAVRGDGDVTVKGGTTVKPDVSAHDSTVTNLSRVLDTLFFQLASQANLVFTTDPGKAAPSDSAGRCAVWRESNWGDVTRTGGLCEGYFPIVYLNPGGPGKSIGLHGDQGQGILLVNGDLKMNGNFAFNGLILVRGQYETGGGTMTLTGSLITQNVDLDPNKWTGGLELQYSSCAVNTALNNLAVSAPATYRSFIQF